MEEFVKFTPERTKEYEKAGYRFVGKNKHTAVQLCRWTKSKIKGQRNCYKSIYGIKSHRCVQMTSSIDFCSLSCTFCWRKFGKDRFKSENKWDEPEEIVDGLIGAQRNLLSGFGGIVPKENFAQAMDPHHVAISLDGEPTLYPKIADLIKEIKNRKMTVFIVTNGTMPNRIKEMNDIEDYGKVIEEKTSYIPKLKDKTSRVIIYLKDEKTWKWNLEKIKEQDEMLNSRPVSKFRTKRVLTK